MDKEPKAPIYGYGKRPLWQWIVLYIVIGGLIYGLVYYFVFAKNGGYSNNSTKKTQTTLHPPATTAVIYKLQSDAHGMYLTDVQGMALYTSDNDTSGVSNCSGTCSTNWPPYISGTATESLPANISVIIRPDGSKQFAWKGKPLYYFSGDTKAGQTTGDNVGGFHLATQ